MIVDKMTNESIARICHEANRAYCLAIGDDSQVPWEEAPAWQKESALKGVKFHFDASSTVSPERSHNCWMKEKLLSGWRYGPVKDVEFKYHPCLLPYDSLPEEQKHKNVLFAAIVNSFLD